MSRLINADELADMKFSQGCACTGIVCVPLAEVKENIRRAKTADIDKDVRAEAYNKGLNDAWEFVKKVDDIPYGELEKIFGVDSKNPWQNVFKTTPQEALAKLEEYEKEQAKIKVGDVVQYKSIQGEWIDVLCTNIIKSNDHRYADRLQGICADGRTDNNSIDVYRKTGKHIDIQSFLQQIGGGSDE